MAKPTKITKQLIDDIAGHISQGVTPEVASQIEGISPRTYYNWMEKGREGIEPYVQFLQSTLRARTLLRAKIEFTLAETDPRFFATRSPIMREGDIPGWHNFEKPDRVQVNVVTVSSIIDDALDSLPGPFDILALPNVDDKEIKFIGENGNQPANEVGSDIEEVD